MSHYKSAIAAQSRPETADNVPYKAEARQLKEFFPSWSNDDLQSLLVEVGGDIQIAATRISEGHVEQWGSVSRKKDKKTGGNHTKDGSFSARAAPVRGGRGGGRGGRGGASGRGGAIRGGRGRANGHVAHGHGTRGSVNANADVGAAVHASWADAPVPTASTEWGLSPEWNDTAPAIATDAWDSNIGSTTAPVQAVTAVSTAPTVNGNSYAHTTPSAPPPKPTPATSKLSWAQIARPQEKAPAPAIASPATKPAPPTEPESVPESPASLAAAEPQAGWEEPTTVEAPTWDDEPVRVEAASSTWQATSEPEPAPLAPAEEPQPVEELAELAPTVEPEPVPEPVHVAAPEAKPEVKEIKTSSEVKASPRPSRANAAPVRFGKSAVAMPTFPGLEKLGMQFGSLGLGDEEALDQPTAAPAAPVSSFSPPTQSSVTPSISQPALQVLPQAQVPTSPSVPSIAPSTQAPARSSSVTATPQQAFASLQPATPASHVAAATSPIQPHNQAQSSSFNPLDAVPAQQQQPSQPASRTPYLNNATPAASQAQEEAASHFSGFSSNNQTATAFGSSHPVSSGDEASQSQGSFSSGQVPSTFPGNQGFSGAPQSPAFLQSQTAQTVTTSAAPGVGQHQQGAFPGFGMGGGSMDYGYDNQRGFYGQSSFSDRLGHGHEEQIKGLPAAQIQQNASSVPPQAQVPAQPTPASQPPPQNPGTPQAHLSAQSQSQQPQQQNYVPPPVPYYYNPYPQNQFYGTPYNSAGSPYSSPAYGVPHQAQYVKYPTMFPGPAGAGQGTGGKAGPQGNPYSQLYAQGSYDEYQPPHQPGHASLGLGDYGKQLYGSGQAFTGGQGFAGGASQGFIGLGGNPAGGPGTGSAAGAQQRASPETAYKPYGAKDSAVGAASRIQQQQQQQHTPPQGQGYGSQGQGQGQYGAGSQGFSQGGGQGQYGNPPFGQGQGGTGASTYGQGQGQYYGNRFGGGSGSGAASAAAGGPAPHHQPGGASSSYQQQGAGSYQGNAYQQAGAGANPNAGHLTGAPAHLGYPQGGNDGAFYSYQHQPRQQAFWP
ncbi:hypothetical protein FISHEDRAFT_74442 [Fistulina hepatica ATCC 64428]|uniref:RNA polymerase II degradation factor 1 n=1 Tax=Fistulina hepatica ATCC 64428 TaxID=1128425 RepID=A0A0D7A9Y2_9AGAR|nr:hypothetical protein FISHEDRAFT_74442 [Fistulina hepatica ATCC 64428]